MNDSEVPSSFYFSLFILFFWGGEGWNGYEKLEFSLSTFPTSRYVEVHQTPKKCPGQDAETLLHFASCFVNSPGWVKGSGILFFSWLISGKKKTWNNWGIQSSIYTRFITIFPNWSLYSPGGSLFQDIAKSNFRAENIKHKSSKTHVAAQVSLLEKYILFWISKKNVPLFSK